MEPKTPREAQAQATAEAFETVRELQWRKGAQDYGRYGYLDIPMPDMFRMMKEELVDVANYAQMLFVKICEVERTFNNAMDAHRSEQASGVHTTPDGTHGPA
jgi:hypothetical protein